MNRPPPPKGVVGAKVKAKVTELRNGNVPRVVFGRPYKEIFSPGVVTAFERRVGNGPRGRLVSYITAEYLSRAAAPTTLSVATMTMVTLT